MIRALPRLIFILILMAGGAVFAAEFPKKDSGTGSDHDPKYLGQGAAPGSRGPDNILRFSHPRDSALPIEVSSPEQFQKFQEIQKLPGLKDLPLSIFLLAEANKKDVEFMRKVFEQTTAIHNAKDFGAAKAPTIKLAELVKDLIPAYTKLLPLGVAQFNQSRLFADLTLNDKVTGDPDSKEEKEKLKLVRDQLEGTPILKAAIDKEIARINEGSIESGPAPLVAKLKAGPPTSDGKTEAGPALKGNGNPDAKTEDTKKAATEAGELPRGSNLIGTGDKQLPDKKDKNDELENPENKNDNDNNPNKNASSPPPPPPDDKKGGETPPPPPPGGDPGKYQSSNKGIPGQPAPKGMQLTDYKDPGQTPDTQLSADFQAKTGAQPIDDGERSRKFLEDFLTAKGEGDKLKAEALIRNEKSAEAMLMRNQEMRQSQEAFETNAARAAQERALAEQASANQNRITPQLTNPNRNIPTLGRTRAPTAVANRLTTPSRTGGSNLQRAFKR